MTEGRADGKFAAFVMNAAGDSASTDKCVLIVEDNPLNMKLFTTMIEAQGYHVLQASDGVRGLYLAQQKHPDLIIMDIQLPDMSGLEVTRSLKANNDTRDIPIIIATAHELSGDKEEIRASGCDGFIAKPIAVAEFLEFVEFFVTRGAAHRDTPAGQAGATESGVDCNASEDPDLSSGMAV